MDGPLENWTTGALRLNGTDQYAVLSNEKATEPVTYEFSYQVPQWVTITRPVKMMPGEDYRVEIKLQGIEKGMKLHADLNWRKTNGRFAGTASWGGPPREITGKGPYVFTYTPPDKEDLGAYILAVFFSTTDKWADKTRMATVNIPKGDPEGKTKTITPPSGKQTVRRTASGEDLKSPQIHTSNFLIEAYFRTAPGHTGGTLMRKMDRAGYRLTVNRDGAVEFAVAGTSGSARLAGRMVVNDGGVLISYEFDVDSVGEYEVWGRLGHEFVRAPFEWRIDEGPWDTIDPREDLSIDMMEITRWVEVAWVEMGKTTLEPGTHTLQTRHTVHYKDEGDKKKPQRIIYEADAFCLYQGDFRPNGRHKPGADWQTERDIAAGPRQEPDGPHAFHQ